MECLHTIDGNIVLRHIKTAYLAEIIEIVIAARRNRDACIVFQCIRQIVYTETLDLIRIHDRKRRRRFAELHRNLAGRARRIIQSRRIDMHRRGSDGMPRIDIGRL